MVDAFRVALLDEKIDPALAAEILALPSVSEIAELFDIIDLIAITEVRKALAHTLAAKLADEFPAIYNANHPDKCRVEHADIGKCMLRSACLCLLVLGEAHLVDTLASKQYRKANNMTDVLAALSVAITAQLPYHNALMQEYDDKWHHDGLVIGKWFILQSTSPVKNMLETVRGLLKYRSFSMGNLNRTRSSIGTFADSNPVIFYVENGSGYQFLIDILAEFNSCNPQMVSRLIESLIRLKYYDARCRTKMCAALEQLKGLENFSGDLFKKISKTLT